MPGLPKPHEHADPEEVIHPHENMLADTPAQAAGAPYARDKEEAIAALREPTLRCCRCDLCATRTQVVFGEGSPAARLMIVGEAPGADEDRSGHPFVGRAGKILDSLLEEAGISRGDVWITNTVKCRPTTVNGKRVSNRPPRAPEIAACAIWRTGELEILRPEVICCLGAVAARAILGREVKMTSERGSWLALSPPIAGMESSAVIVSYHPAYILRQQGEAFERIRAQALADFAAIAARLGQTPGD